MLTFHRCKSTPRDVWNQNRDLNFRSLHPNILIQDGLVWLARPATITLHIYSILTVNKHGGERCRGLQRPPFHIFSQENGHHVHIKKIREIHEVSIKYIVTNHKKMTITPCASGYTERHSAWTVTFIALFRVLYFATVENPHCLHGEGLGGAMHRWFPLLQNWADRRR